MDNKTIEVNVKSDTLAVILEKVFNISIEVKNKSNLTMDKIFIKNFIDNKAITLVPGTFKIGGILQDIKRIDETINIDCLKPKEVQVLEFKAYIKNPIQNYKCNMYSMAYYNDQEYNLGFEKKEKSNVLKLDLYYPDLYGIAGENFIITSNKSLIKKGEDVAYTLKIRNTGNIPATNIVINKFYPKYGMIVINSLQSNMNECVKLNGDRILITKLEPNEEINLRYSIVFNMNPRIIDINIQPSMIFNYCFGNIKEEFECECIANNCNVRFLRNSFFDENSFIHRVDKKYAYIDDIVNHQIIIKNLRSFDIRSLKLVDCSEENLEFVKNSLYVNGILRIDEDINSAVELGEIESGEEIVIEYKTKAIKPLKNYIIRSKVIYSYYDNNILQQDIEEFSNVSTLSIYGVILGEGKYLTKKSDKDIAAIDEEITYSIKIKNNGNIIAENVILNDEIPKGVEIKQDTFTLNNQKVCDINLNEGFFIGHIEPGEEFNITYKVIVKEFIDYTQKSRAYVKYNYKVDDNKKINKSSFSTETILNIVMAELGNTNDIKCFVKEVDNLSGKIGDILNINLILENRGNLKAEYVKIIEPKNEALEFVCGSLWVGVVNLKDANIFNGIDSLKLNPKETMHISYKVKIIDFPRPNPIADRAKVIYSYVLDHNGEMKNVEVFSTNPKINVASAILDLKDCLAVKKEKNIYKYGVKNSNIPFKLNIFNKGNLDAKNVELILNLNDDVNLNCDSIIVDGKEIKNFKFNSSLSLKDIDPKEEVEVIFDLNNDNCEIDKDLRLKCKVKYSFIDTLDKEVIQESCLEEIIKIVDAKLEVEKECTKEYVAVGDEITEIINIKNLGNVTFENLILKNKNLKFLEPNLSSLMINGVFINEPCQDDILYLDNLRPNENKTISLRYEVVDIPIYDAVLNSCEVVGSYRIYENSDANLVKVDSNSKTLNVVKSDVLIEQKTDQESFLVGDNINHFIKVTNTGSNTLEKASIFIDIPPTLKYVNNSITLNGIPLKIESLIYEVPLGDIKVNETKAINLIIKVLKRTYNSRANIGCSVNGEFTINPEKPNVIKNFKAQNHIINIEELQVKVLKSSSKNYIQKGEKVTITNLISNDGTIPIKNVIFRELKSASLLFQEKSLKIDGKLKYRYNPYDGVKIEYLMPGESLAISSEYEYDFNGYESVIESKSYINFVWTLDNEDYKEEKVYSNSIGIEAALSTFKQFNVEKEVKLYCNEPKIKEVLNVIVEPEILNSYEISTIKSTSYENQNLTGSKMVIRGILKEKIQYSVDDEVSSLYMITREELFNTFIVIPEGVWSENIQFDVRVENVYFRLVDNKTIFKNVMLIVEGLL